MLSVEAEPCKTLSLIKVSYTDFNSWQKRQPKIKETWDSPVVYEPVDIRELPACCPGSDKTHLYRQQQWKEPMPDHPSQLLELNHSMKTCTAPVFSPLRSTAWLLSLFLKPDELADFLTVKWAITKTLTNVKQQDLDFFLPLSHEFRTDSNQNNIIFFFFPNKTISFPQWKKMRTKSSWTKLSLLKPPLQRTKTTHWRTTLLFRARLVMQVLHWLVFLKTDGPHAKS